MWMCESRPTLMCEQTRTNVLNFLATSKATELTSSHTDSHGNLKICAATLWTIWNDVMWWHIMTSRLSDSHFSCDQRTVLAVWALSVMPVNDPDLSRFCGLIWDSCHHMSNYRKLNTVLYLKQSLCIIFKMCNGHVQYIFMYLGKCSYCTTWGTSVMCNNIVQ